MGCHGGRCRYRNRFAREPRFQHQLTDPADVRATPEPCSATALTQSLSVSRLLGDGAEVALFASEVVASTFFRSLWH